MELSRSEMDGLHIVPPSGEWHGFYLQNGEKNFFTMHLSFSSSSNGVHGHCTDNEVVNFSWINSEIFGQRGIHIVEGCLISSDPGTN